MDAYCWWLVLTFFQCFIPPDNQSSSDSNGVSSAELELESSWFGLNKIRFRLSINLVLIPFPEWYWCDRPVVPGSVFFVAFWSVFVVKKILVQMPNLIIFAIGLALVPDLMGFFAFILPAGFFLFERCDVLSAGVWIVSTVVSDAFNRFLYKPLFSTLHSILFSTASTLCLWVIVTM